MERGATQQGLGREAYERRARVIAQVGETILGQCVKSLSASPELECEINIRERQSAPSPRDTFIHVQWSESTGKVRRDSIKPKGLLEVKPSV